MTTDRLRKFTITALMAALTCIATFMRVPAPLGYIHLGDAFVILSGITLGPIYGACAAGIGSLLPDLLGYPHYALATLLIKALTALVSSLIYRWFKKNIYSVIAAGIIGGIIVTLGYFTFEYYILGFEAAAISGIPLNGVQNLFGIILSTLLYPLLIRVPQIKNLTD